MAPRFDDLFPFDRGLCHLRVYDGADGQPVALAMQVQDSPGPGVVNAAEALLERVTVVFGGESRMFVIFPETLETWTEVIHQAGKESVEFVSDVAHAEIERLAGEAVTLPSADRWAAVDLGGPRHPLLALVPPPEEPVGPFDEMDVVAVADLPWAHNPFKCAHRERFQEIRRLYDKDSDGDVPAGAHFFLSLDAGCFASCRYHQHDWAAIADASIHLLESLAPGSTRSDMFSAAAELLPEGPDRDELRCLFIDPIAWSPGTTSITNGQYRTCALKASGAQLCAAVLSGGRSGYTAAPRDAHRRAQRTLAEYWVHELGEELE